MSQNIEQPAKVKAERCEAKARELNKFQNCSNTKNVKKILNSYGVKSGVSTNGNVPICVNDVRFTFCR